MFLRSTVGGIGSGELIIGHGENKMGMCFEWDGNVIETDTYVLVV